MAFEALKEMQATMWGQGQFELMAATLAPVHDDLVQRLGVKPGEAWLDVATGTGAVAVRAARQGAKVSGQDIAPAQIDMAKRLADAEELDIEFEVGDVEQLRYPDASFDVISSAQGAILGPDHPAVARELARVCRGGGRIGLTAWRPGGSIEKSFRMLGRFQPPPPEGAGSPCDWGRREHVTGLLGDEFELEFFDGESPQLADSPEELWDLFLASMGPLRLLLAASDDARRQEIHDSFIDFYRDYTLKDGSVSQPREYVVIIGHKR